MRIRVIDAFTDRPFAGNPAAVCVLDDWGHHPPRYGPEHGARVDRGGGIWPDETWMRRVAAEMNLSETAFSHPLPPGAEADFALRWFTPVNEVNLCGHATLATAHALATDGRVPDGTVRFASRSGVLVAHIGEDRITLDFPVATPTVATVPDGLAEALGAKPDALYGTGALRDLVAQFPDEATVRGLDPDFRAVARVCAREGIRGVIVTSAADAGKPYDFVSRMFAPAGLGTANPEDPVTGSAHTALAPFWSARYGRDELTGLQVSARTGLVRTALRGDRVHLTGQAVTVLDGDFKPVPA